MLKQINAVALAAVLASLASDVHGHGHLVSPRSRNYVAQKDGVWWPLDGSTPYPETCSHCLNIGGTEARCGLVNDRNYDYPKTSNGGAQAPAIQGCYAEGDVVELDVVITAHHMGHFSYKACAINAGEVASQECFDSNPLTFVEDVLYGSLPDPNHPDRAYIPRADASFIQTDLNGDYIFSHRYRLPEGLSGDLVLLQWHWITGNSCLADDGYLTYDFPTGFEPIEEIGLCGPIPPDGNGAPEQFWNCAEIRITSDCASEPPPPSPPTTTTPAPTKAVNPPPTTQAPTNEVNPPSSPPPPSSCCTHNNECGPSNPCSNGMCCSQWGFCGTTEEYCGECCQNNCSGEPPSPPPPSPSPPTTNPPPPTSPPPPPSSCPAENNACGPNNPCSNGMCCSQWGYCGTTDEYCGECCQHNCSGQPSSPPPPSPGPPTTNPPPSPPGFNYDADHGEDSRLIAYVGNWQACPTDAQIDAYSHIVIAFAVSYIWSPGGNNCDAQCQVPSNVPLCNNQARPDLIERWQGMGKKVILSFGGAGMGGSWSGDPNNCWDYCFGREEQLSTDLVNIVSSQNLDGVDIDYEYCYDIAGKQAGRCGQRTSLYSDAGAQTFLNSMTSLLRTKLDALQDSNGYNRGRYEITHAPMDTDLVASNGHDSIYFNILHDRRADLDFLMPQFYNGYTRAGLDGFDGTGAGSMKASDIYSSLANEMFDHEPNKVVFGHCISDCGGTGSNVNAGQAVQIQQELKEFNNGEFACNGGAFFWVATHDVGGAWSDAVVAEVSQTAGCSNSQTTPAPSKAPTSPPNNEPTTPEPTSVQTPQPTPLPTVPPTQAPQATPATPQPTGELVLDTSPRCGSSELHARETCGNVCTYTHECAAGEYCWGVHANYCGSIPKRVYTNPVQSTVWARCGTSEAHARTFCGEPCTWQCAGEGEVCIGIHSNYCGSEYYEETS